MFSLLFLPVEASAWSNGGYSDDPSTPDYGTHDWIAHHALDWLPAEEKAYIEADLSIYLYGTELPDNNQASDGIGDTPNHHVYYFANGSLQDDASAVRAETVYQEALQFLLDGNLTFAAKYAGILAHYVSDVGVFGHVMGSGTVWGGETHHSDYESYVNTRTNEYDDEFNVYLAFDGSLDAPSAYDATLELAFDTTFDVDGDLTAVWMDQNYNWSDPSFRERAGESLSLCVNLVTDVLHGLYLEAQQGGEEIADHVVINEVELNPPGNDNALDVEEWLELCNPTDQVVDVDDWTLRTTHDGTVSIALSPGTSIQPGGYLVIGRGSQWLDNTDESVVLEDGEGVEVDRTPLLTDGEDDTNTWQRYPDGRDADTMEDWVFAGATPEYENIPEFPIVFQSIALISILFLSTLLLRRKVSKAIS